MKALRYLLMVVAMVSVLSVKAQSTAQLPEAQMQSTSAMVGSGSTLPQAATTGAYVTGSTVGTYSPAKIHPGQPRRGLDDDDEGEGGSTPKPGQPFPIGDAVWPLALLACAYLIVRVVRARKRA
jgi:hypothetical protein